MKEVNVFWFRRDVRLYDNHGLYQALISSDSVLAVFIFDKNILNALQDKQDNIVLFIHQTLKQLNNEFIKRGSSLFVIYADPLDAFEIICKSFLVKEVFTNQDYEPYAIDRDLKISDWLKSKGILFRSFKDQVIFEKSEVIKPGGTPYTIFTLYSKTWKQKLAKEQIRTFPSETLLSNLIKTELFHFPALEEIGFDKAVMNIPHLEIDKNVIRNYHLTRNIPFGKGTTRLSIHLRFGTVSVRELIKVALELNEQWLNELIWREFFMMILFHFPDVVIKSFREEYENIKWRNNEAEFKLWCKGETGYPIVDSGMRELNETGFMHNRVRMIVASFLTKHLLIDWRWGEAYFAGKLLDYELSSNNGNWQWAAGCGCDAAPYFRIFNPAMQTKRFDPELLYIKKWIKDFRPDYLPPIVEHDFARKRALEAFKKALRP
jgi:deoxyribodipyrimidine photo-lyase